LKDPAEEVVGGLAAETVARKLDDTANVVDEEVKPGSDDQPSPPTLFR
jgi:hypothetical protein